MLQEASPSSDVRAAAPGTVEIVLNASSHCSSHHRGAAPRGGVGPDQGRRSDGAVPAAVGGHRVGPAPLVVGRHRLGVRAVDLGERQRKILAWAPTGAYNALHSLTALLRYLVPARTEHGEADGDCGAALASAISAAVAAAAHLLAPKLRTKSIKLPTFFKKSRIESQPALLPLPLGSVSVSIHDYFSRFLHQISHKT